MNEERQNNVILAVLTAAVCGLAVVAGIWGVASWLEAFSFVTGAICVWLVVRENIWNFPIGIVNVSAYCVVFFQSRLYADSGLQVVYFVLGFVGWGMWLNGGTEKRPLRIVRAQNVELISVISFVAISTFVLWFTLGQRWQSAIESIDRLLTLH